MAWRVPSSLLPNRGRRGARASAGGDEKKLRRPGARVSPERRIRENAAIGSGGTQVRSVSRLGRCCHCHPSAFEEHRIIFKDMTGNEVTGHLFEIR